MKHLFSFVFVATCLAAPVALACPDHKAGGLPHHLAEQDSNADGKLTLAEMKAGAEARFKRMDANEDGSVDSEEIHAAMLAKHAARARHSHGDGKGGHCGHCDKGEGKGKHCDHAGGGEGKGEACPHCEHWGKERRGPGPGAGSAPGHHDAPRAPPKAAPAK